MSFLDRLVARSLGTPAALQPRPLSPFEALGPRALQDSVEALEVETSFEGQAPSHAAPSPPPVAPIFTSPAALEPAPSVTLGPTLNSPLPAPPVPLWPPATQVPIPTVEGFRRHNEPAPSAQPSPRVEALTPRPEAPPKPEGPRPQAEPRIPLVPRSADPRPTVDVRRERVVQTVPAVSAAPAAMKATLAMGLQPLPSAPPRRLPAAPLAAPDVHIHIGRIEVRATRPEAAPAPSRPPEAAGPSALESYLEARTRGTR